MDNIFKKNFDQAPYKTNNKKQKKSFKSITLHKSKQLQRKINKNNGTHRLINQITSGLTSTNNLTETVKCSQCVGTFTCESSESSDWIIELKYDPETHLLYFQCGCGIGNKPMVHCKHIAAVLIKLVSNQAKLINKEEQMQMDADDLTNVITSIMDIEL